MESIKTEGAERITALEYQMLSQRTDGNSMFYRTLAERLFKQPGFQGLGLIHAVMGLAGEVGEVTDTVKKHIIYNKHLDVENVKEECGDILWYMSLLLFEINSTFEEVMEMNIAKLKLRYPMAFTEELAHERKDKAGSDV